MVVPFSLKFYLIIALKPAPVNPFLNYFILLIKYFHQKMQIISGRFVTKVLQFGNDANVTKWCRLVTKKLQRGYKKLQRRALRFLIGCAPANKKLQGSHRNLGDQLTVLPNLTAKLTLGEASAPTLETIGESEAVPSHFLYPLSLSL